MNITSINNSITKINNYPTYGNSQSNASAYQPIKYTSQPAMGDVFFKGGLSAIAKTSTPLLDLPTISKAKKIWNVIKKQDNIVIVTHRFADGDAISSGLAVLNEVSRKFPSKKVAFYVPHGYPSFLSEVPGVQKITREKPNFDNVGLAISVDSLEDNIDGFDMYKKASEHIIIDHHKANQELNSLSIVDDQAASATTVLYNKLFKPLGNDMSPESAECLLTGLITDTGRFSHVHGAEEALKMKEELLADYGNSGTTISSIISKLDKNEKISHELENLKDFLINKGMKTFTTDGNKDISYAVLTQDMVDKFNVKDSLPDIKQTLSSVVSADTGNDIKVLFWEVEKDAKVKVSMRSEEADICGLAKSFNGNGHPHAAGFEAKGSINDIVSNVLSGIKSYKF